MTQPILDNFRDVAISSLSAADLRKGALRLDASFYDLENLNAQRTLANSGLKIDTLSNVAEVFCSNLRGRTFVSAATGVPLLGGHNLDTDDERDIKYLSKVLTRGIETEQLVRGDVLLSSAGTVGLFDFVWDNHEGKLASQHIIRLRPIKGKIEPGYLYSYISSPLALAMVASQSAGSVIVTLYIEHLTDFPLPRLKPQLEQLIHDKIVDSFAKRREYRDLSRLAQQQAIGINRLKPLPKDNEDAPDVFAIPCASHIAQGAELRLEAHCHNPIARAALANLQECPSQKRTVGALSHDVIIGGRSKRNYVESAYGTPFLSGKNLIQIRPSDVKHVSNSETADLKDMLLSRGWILVTRSGTIGRTCFVWHNYENYAASEHILRVIPIKEQVYPGYLYAFLASEYGYEQISRFRFGSVIDEISNHQLKQVIIPLPSPEQQREIGDLVRQAYEKRAEALQLEDEAQEILLNEISGKNTNTMRRQHV